MKATSGQWKAVVTVCTFQYTWNTVFNSPIVNIFPPKNSRTEKDNLGFPFDY